MSRRTSVSDWLSGAGALLVPLALCCGHGCGDEQPEKVVERAEQTPSVTGDATRQKPADSPSVSAAESARPEAQAPDLTEKRGAAVVTDATFGEVTGKGVVLVDLWSQRCPPCRMQGPIVDRLAGRFAGRAVVAKLNVDANRRAAAALRIMYIPTLVIFKDGAEVKRFVGLKQEETLAAALEQALKQE